MAQPTNIPAKVYAKSKNLSKVVRKLVVLKSSETEFQDIDCQIEGSVYFIVDFSNNSCDCLGWQVSGMLCKHSLACIKSIKS